MLSNQLTIALVGLGDAEARLKDCARSDRPRPAVGLPLCVAVGVERLKTYNST
jgi:hypothetical protein